MPNTRNVTIINSKQETIDLFIINAGKQMKTDHSFGPVSNSHYILQYITSGKGVFICNGKEYEVNKSDLFLLPKNVEVSYHSDKEDPYEYYWIMFDGSYANVLLDLCGLTKDTPVINIDNKKVRTAFADTFNIIALNNAYSSIQLLANFFLIIAQVVKNIPEHNNEFNNPILEKAKVYMLENYKRDISIEEMCSILYINRNYFSQIFKKKYNLTPKQYLINLRMREAARLLRTTDDLVYQVADKVGMTTLSFIKLFKLTFECTPNEYRRNQQKQNKVIVNN